MEIHEISDERLSDLLCCAFEGGSNHWINTADSIEPLSKNVYNFEVPFENDGKLEIVTVDNEKYILDRQSIDSGLDVMQNKYPRHMKDFLDENEDADTGDVFLQCCLFGEAVYC